MVCARRTSGFLGGTSHLRVKLSNTRIQALNLLQIHPAEVRNLGMQRSVITCDCVRESLEMGRPSGRDQSVFGEVAACHARGVLSARRVDHLGALADKHLPRAKQHSTGLLIFRLHCDKAPSRRCVHRLPGK